MVRQKIKNWLFWAPRALSLLFILFLSLFAFDVFGNGEPFVKVLIALLIHLIPNFVLLIILLIAWRYEQLGSVLFFLTAFIFAIVFKVKEVLTFSFLIFPLILIGILFFIDWYINKKNKQKKKKFSF